MTAILEAKNLVKRVGDLTAVNGISLDIQKGEIFSLLGPNGAGMRPSNFMGVSPNGMG
jgi:ABC-2 type transport system ATP-binding protein